MRDRKISFLVAVLFINAYDALSTYSHVLIISSLFLDKDLPSIALPVGEGRNNLWGKTKEAFKYVYSRYNGSYDWVLKADDDT